MSDLIMSPNLCKPIMLSILSIPITRARKKLVNVDSLLNSDRMNFSNEGLEGDEQVRNSMQVNRLISGPFRAEFRPTHRPIERGISA